MNRWPFLILLLLIVPLFVTGCWDSKELNSLSIISATSIDRERDHWVVTFQVIIPQAIATQTGGGGAGSQSPTTIFSTNGRTIREAMQNASLETSRMLFFAHNSILILSEKVAREEGVGQILDFFLRPFESRETMSILLTKGKASDLLEVLIPLEKISGNAVKRVIDQSQRNLSQVQNIKLINFAARVADPNASAMVPELQVSGNLKGQSSLDALKSPRNEAVIKLGELGVFRRDKLVGWLNGEESRGVAWLSNRVKNLIIVYPCSAKGGERDSLSSFRVLKSSTKLSSEIQGGKVTMKVQINARGVLDETGCKMDLSNPRVIAEQQRIIAKVINGEVVSTWNRLRTIETDAPGFLDVIHREHPDAWKKLAQSKHPLDEITIRPQIRVNIEHTDMINKPYSTLLEQNKRP